MDKILSVIIPAFNMERYLQDCFFSLVVSSPLMECLEVIVINDGSTDKTPAIAKQWATKYPKIFFAIDKENGNYGSCVNRGLSVATGKYIKVLDADDSFEKSNVEDYLKFLMDVEADLIISNFCLIDGMGKITETCIFSLPDDVPFTLSALSKREVKWLWHHAITYRRTLLTAMGYRQTEGISYTDDEWIFKPMASVNVIRFFPHILYRYLRGREGQTFDPKVLQMSFNQRMMVMESMLRFFTTAYSQTSKDAQGYLRKKLQLRLESIYHYMLIVNRNDENNRQLMAFDLHVKTISQEAYKMMDCVSDEKTGFRYILTWRNNGYNYKVPTLFILYVKHQCRKILKRLKFL